MLECIAYQSGKEAHPIRLRHSKHRDCIIRRKTGNILGERYAWIKFTIYDKEKQDAEEFVYGNLRVWKEQACLK